MDLARPFSLARAPLALLLALPLTAAPLDRAPGEWVQISLSGSLQRPGGARIELTVAAVDRVGEERRVSLEPHLAEATPAHDIASLLAQRLERAGIDHWLSSTEVQEPALRRDLFVERAVFVRLRLGHGLQSVLTVCEGAPSAVRVQPPVVTLEPGSLSFTASARHAHTEARSRERVHVNLAPTMHAARISEALSSQCLERGMIADRPRQDAWRILKLGDGSTLTGFSIGLQSTGDWALELELP